ncbi:MAG: hypothetical protein ACM3JL_00815 [Nitrososphaerota archaeon]
MAEVLILEFEGVGVDFYNRVNEKLGIDMESGEGDWPQGLLTHSAGLQGDKMVVYEVWASQADQERFMEERLGRALQEGGVAGPPKRVEWFELAAHHDPGR